MKKCTITLMLFTLIFQINLLAVEWHWSEIIGDTEFVATRGVSTDPFGNVYVIGEFDGVLTFGDTQLVAESASEYTPDGFLAKFDQDGYVIWAVRIGNLSSTNIRGVDHDAQGNVYVAGHFHSGFPDMNVSAHGPLNLQSSDGEYESLEPINRRNLFVAKYNDEGLLQWANTASGESEIICFAYAHDLAVDDDGYAVITGQYWRQLNIGDYEFVPEGYGDGYVAKYDPSGDLVWAKEMNMSYHGRNRHVSLDSQGNVFLAGLFEETTIIFPDTVFYATAPDDYTQAEKSEKTERLKRFYKPPPDRTDDIRAHAFHSIKADNEDKHIYLPIVEDAFIAKYNADGEYQWARHIGGLQDEQILGLEVDQNGNPVMAINYQWDIVIGDSIFQAALTGIDVSWYDMVLAKFNGDGEFLWAVREGKNTPWIWADDLAIDESGRITLVGRYRGSPSFGEDISPPYSVSGAGFIASYTAHGTVHDVFDVSSNISNAFQWVDGVEIFPAGERLISGGFYGGVTLNEEDYYAQGHADAFLSKTTLDLPVPTINYPGPENLSVEIIDEYNGLLHWDSLPPIPDEEFELFHGPEDAIGTGSSPNTHIAVGYQVEEPVIITSIKSYLTPRTNFAQDLTFYIYGNNNGLPDPENVLGGPYVVEIPSGSLGDAMWVEAFFEGIEMPENTIFHIVQNWSMNDFDIGTASDVPTTMNSVFLGEWLSLDDLNAPQGLILRATGAFLQTALGYNVYRDGTKIHADTIIEPSFLDVKLPYGTFDYHVTGVYQQGETLPSETVQLTVNFPNHTEFTLHITTNNDESPQGAIASLVNHDSSSDHEYAYTAQEDGLIIFPDVWTGWGEEVYYLTINHPHYSTFKAEGIEITVDGGTMDVLLKEYIASPFNLYVETEGMEAGQALFTWNNEETLFEGFEENVFPPEGWTKFNLDDGTGWDQIETGEAPPGYDGSVESAPGGGEKMAFVTYATGGENMNDQWLVTPQIVITEDFILSFYLQYLPFLEDNVDIRISTSVQDDPDAFDILVDHLYFDENCSMEWEFYTYNLTDYVPAGTPVYIAFREHMEFYPDASPVILLDNVYIGPSEKQPQALSGGAFPKETECAVSLNNAKAKNKALLGFNVYLNDLTHPVSSLIEEPSFLFSELKDGEHVAGVQSVFTTGESDIITRNFSVEGEVNAPDITIPGNVKVFPNPVAEIVNIIADETIRKVVLYDPAGNKIYSGLHESSNAKIYVGDKKEGLYVLRVHTSSSVNTHKILLVR